MPPKKPQVQKWTKEKLEQTIKKKKECNAKAQRIVEMLIEGKIEECELSSHLDCINQCHYQDIVEERAISKICGYPICDNPLVNIPKKQYHISVLERKVYDITERKNFCSNGCYKSSCYLKQQLLTSPLWLRDVEVVPEFKFLAINDTELSIGNELDFSKIVSKDVVRRDHEK